MLRNTDEHRNPVSFLALLNFSAFAQTGSYYSNSLSFQTKVSLGFSFHYSQVYQETSPDWSKLASSLFIQYVAVT